MLSCGYLGLLNYVFGLVVVAVEPVIDFVVKFVPHYSCDPREYKGGSAEIFQKS